MTVEEKVQEILSAAAAVTALCPAARIRVPGAWQDMDRPYIIHFPVSVAPMRTHAEGLAALRIYDFYQVSCVADTYGAARTLAEAVIAALDGNHAGTGSPVGSALEAQFIGEAVVKDPDTETEQIALNFRIAFQQ